MVTFDAEMNNNGVRSPVRVIRLDDLDPLPRRAAASPHGAQAAAWVAPPIVDTPSPIGGGVVSTPGLDQALPLSPNRAPRAPRPGPHLQAVPAEEGMPRLPKGEVLTWPVSFQGSAQDYARLCLGNAWRMLLSGGLYWPWARVRSQRYLMRHTVVAGHAMDYHEPPEQLLPRFALVICLLLGVAGAWAGSPLAGMLALSAGVAVWPLLVFMSLNQRVAHVSWARRRLGFEGLCQDVYDALWAPLAGGCALTWLLMAATLWQRPQGWLAWGGALALWLLALPGFVWAWLHFRQVHLRLGPLHLRWQASRLAMQTLFVRTLAWALLTGALSLGLAAMVLAGMLWVRSRAGLAWQAALFTVVAAGVALAVRPYLQARLQNLVWNHSGNRYLRFRSRLSVAGHVRMQCRHALLLVLTLGLYWPWAVVATRRMRAQALVVHARVDTQVLLAHWPTHAAAMASRTPATLL